jgi:diphthine synthase
MLASLIILLQQFYCFASIFYFVCIFYRATTHTDLVVRAKKMGVEVKIVHNASVMNAIGICGLQLYRYGETVSIPFFTDTWRPDSFYEKIRENRNLGLHTLCLLG